MGGNASALLIAPLAPIDGGMTMSSSIGPSTTVAPENAAAPRWAQHIRAVTDYLTNDFLGGPRRLKFAWVIDFQKAGTFVLYGFLLLVLSSTINRCLGVCSHAWQLRAHLDYEGSRFS